MIDEFLAGIMIILLAILIFKDTGSGAEIQLRHIKGNLEKIGSELYSINKTLCWINKKLESVQMTMKISESGEKERWELNDSMEWEKKQWRKQENI